MSTHPLDARFPLGQVVMTANTRETLNPLFVLHAVARHRGGDWGEAGPEDAAENELALEEGFRLFSVYHAGGTKFWVITEADRSVTTVLLPEDY